MKPSRPGYRVSAGYDDSRFKKPSVACDMAIFTFEEKSLKLLLIKRRFDPYAGYWALPGGFVELDEPLETAAARELEEETGVSGIEFFPCGFFGDPERDPRTRVISVAYMALVPAGKLKPKAGDDAKEAAWFPLRNLPELAFDHDLLIGSAIQRLRELTVLRGAALRMLPRKFTLYDIEALLSEVMDREYNQRNLFRRLRSLPCIRRSGWRGEYNLSAAKIKEGTFVFLL